MKNYPLNKVHELLESGPVILVATSHKGRANVMPMSWHTMIDFDPPLVGCVISDQSLTFRNLLASKECVIAIPEARLAKKAVACGNVSGAKCDKFAEFGLTPLPAAAVKAPLVGECRVNLECRLHDARLAKKYNLFVFRVVKAHAAAGAPGNLKTFHHLGGGRFMTPGRKLRMK